MKKHRFALLGIFVGFSSLITTSCMVNPELGYSQQSGGFGMGQGFGNPNFSSSIFVNTGNPRWAYDPYAGAYFDHSRRCYYDPHLCGYYPMGFRPAFVQGAPHPHGWRRGHSYCAPPSVIRNTTISITRNRSRQYRDLGNNWSQYIKSDDYDHQPHHRGRYQRQEMQQRVPNSGDHYMPQDGQRYDKTRVIQQMNLQASQSDTQTPEMNMSTTNQAAEITSPPVVVSTVEQSQPTVISQVATAEPSTIALGEGQ